MRSNREYDYFGNVLEYEYDYFPPYSSTSTQKVLVLEYEYKYKYMSTITPFLILTNLFLSFLCVFLLLPLLPDLRSSLTAVIFSSFVVETCQ